MNEPQGVDLVDIHEILGANVGEDDVGAGDARVGEEDVEAAVALHCVVDDGLDLCFIRGIELARVDVDAGVQLCDFLLVSLEVGGVEVADVNGLCAALGVLVGGCSAYSEGGVGACFCVYVCEVSE